MEWSLNTMKIKRWNKCTKTSKRILSKLTFKYTLDCLWMRPKVSLIIWQLSLFWRWQIWDFSEHLLIFTIIFSYNSHKSKNWRVWILADRTCIASCQFYIPFVSPLSSPAVFDKPVIFCNSHYKYSMINLIATIIVNSFFVEAPKQSLYSHSYRTV